MTDKTTKWYDENASAFAEGTVTLDMGPFYKRFLTHVPKGGHILDVGCGPGRDARYFAEHDYHVTALDPSAAMIDLVAKINGVEAILMKVEDIDWVAKFDGIWACASLLHVPRQDMASTMQILTTALKPNGAMYCSFKARDEEWIKEGRYFHGYSEQSFKDLVQSVEDLRIVDCWMTEDVRGRQGENWVNAVVRKVGK